MTSIKVITGSSFQQLTLTGHEAFPVTTCHDNLLHAKQNHAHRNMKLLELQLVQGFQS